MQIKKHTKKSIRDQVRVIIFGTETRAGKLFDLALLWLILFSVIVVIVESIPKVHASFFSFFYVLEWIFTIIFTLEYVARIWSSAKPIRYVFSLWGIVDLLSIMPTLIGIFISGYHYLLVVRIFRLLRIFRVLKLVRYNKEAQVLISSLRSSAYKISIFLFFVLMIVILLGTMMYVIEGGQNGFDSIPQSIYWAIVTLTTVGFGDIVPQTVIGKMLSSVAMILGYAIIAVPTGIVTVDLVRAQGLNKKCETCNFINPENAKFCSSCGDKFSDDVETEKGTNTAV